MSVWLEWPERMPCPRELTVVQVFAEHGTRLGWDDPTREGACGRDEPGACEANLRAAFDEDGVLTCDALACVWEIDGQDFDAARAWLAGPAATAVLTCNDDPATGVTLALGPTPQATAAVWRDDAPPAFPSPDGVDPADDAAARRLADEGLGAVGIAMDRSAALGATFPWPSAADVESWRAVLAGRSQLVRGSGGWRRRYSLDPRIGLVLECTGGRCEVTVGERAVLTEEGGELTVAERLTWLPDGLLIVRSPATRPHPSLDPAALAAVGPSITWRRWRGEIPDEARGGDVLGGDSPGDAPACKAEAWRSRAPDLDGDGAADALVRVRASFGEDCRKPTATVSRTFVLGADGALGARIDARGGPEEAMEREPEAFVALPHGDVTVPPRSLQPCERRGRYVIVATAPRRAFLADTTPGSCPAGSVPR